MTKKVCALFLITLVFSLFLINFVSAAKHNPLTTIIDNIDTIIEKTVDFIEPIAKQLLGNTPNGELLFAKILFLIIIFSIIWVALSRVEFFVEQTWVLVVVSIAVSILATRFLASDALINTLILPYSTLGIAIAAGLPFVLYFLVINIGMKGPRHKTVRKIAWIFFAVIFTGLWISRYDSLTAQNSSAGLIYPVTIGIALAMLFFDGTIQKTLNKIKREKAHAAIVGDRIDELRRKQRDLMKDYAETGDENTLKKAKKLERRIDKLLA